MLLRHRAILGYFRSSGFDGAFAAFQADLTASSSIPAPSSSADDASADLLEKKWSSILRLQKRIIELEQANAQLREDVDSAGKGKKLDLSACLPRAPVRAVLAGHRDQVSAVLFHPVYSLLFSASEDATVRVWDYETARFERSLQGHQDAVTCLALTERGHLLASGSVDLSIKLWDVDSGGFECVKTLQGHDHTVSSVHFVGGGDLLVSASRDKSIKLWEVATGYCVRTLTGHDAWVRRCIVSPLPVSYTTLLPIQPSASNAPSSAASASSTSSSSSLSASSSASSTSAASASFGYLLASCSMDQTIKLWNMRTGECIHTLHEHTHVVEHIAFSNHQADGYIARMLAEEKGSSNQHIHANGTSSTSSSSSSSSSSPSSPPVLSATANTGGGLYLLSCSRDKSIRVWHVSSFTCIRTLVGHDNWVRQAMFVPSGRYILSCRSAPSHTAPRSTRHSQRPELTPPLSPHLSAVCSDDKSLRCWDLSRGCKCVRVLDSAHPSFVVSVDWNRSLPLVASGGVDHSVHVWDCR